MKRSLVIWAFLVTAALLGYFWYRQLDEGHRRFLQNLLRQVPELPGRYAV